MILLCHVINLCMYFEIVSYAFRGEIYDNCFEEK